jgi:hypothetical protein
MTPSLRRATRPAASSSRPRTHEDRPAAQTGEHSFPMRSTAPQSFSFVPAQGVPPAGAALLASGPPSHPQLNPVHLYSASSNPGELYMAQALSAHSTPSRDSSRAFPAPNSAPLEALSSRLAAAAAERDDADDLDFDEDEDITSESSDDDRDARIGPGEVREPHNYTEPYLRCALVRRRDPAQGALCRTRQEETSHEIQTSCRTTVSATRSQARSPRSTACVFKCLYNIAFSTCVVNAGAGHTGIRKGGVWSFIAPSTAMLMFA